MTIDHHTCSNVTIDRFISRELEADGLADFELHLEFCAACRQQLEERVAATEIWQDVRKSLATEVAATSRPILVDEHEPSDSGIAFYRSLLSPSENPQMLGRIGNYEVVGLLGHGGMGIVFKAFDSTLNRYVAIKVLAPQFASSVNAKQRFLREAQAAAAVVHEHVIAIHGVGSWQDRPYLVMSYISGLSLQQRISQSGTLGIREVLRIGMQVASGLRAAHEQGLIHRDVKPANILMETGVDRVVLTDFGLARAVDDIRLTHSDTLLGTPQYMSPEQASDGAIDHRTDLFSLGSVLYESISGRAAFHAATSYGVLRKICEAEPIQLRQLNPDVPLWFEQLVMKLMSKDRNDRFTTTAEVETLLKQCLAHIEQPTTIKLPPQLVEKNPLPYLRWSLIMSTALILLAVTVLTVAPLTQFKARELSENTSHQRLHDPDDTPTLSVAQTTDTKYTTAEEAYGVGAAFYNARSYKNSREPFEAAIKLAKDDEMRLKAYQALLPAYREIPEFEPFQTAAEFIISKSPQSAERSLTQRAFLSFAFNRGQIDNLIKRYEAKLKEDPNNYVAVYLLSEIYQADNRDPKRSIELIKQLESIEKKRFPTDKNEPKSTADMAKIAIEKSKLAAQYVKAKEFKKAAKLYEEIAPLDPTTQAWNLKEAASAWLKDGNRKDALRVAGLAEKAEPEKRNDQLTHFFHRNLGDIFMQLGKPAEAVPHYEIAVKKTQIEGYVKDTKASLAEAIEKSK